MNNVRHLVRALAGACLVLATVQARPPNVILVLADDVSAREFSLYGGGIRTPELERMAREGVVFRDAWSCARCGPSRAILQTGKYPHRHGYFDNEITPAVPFFRDHRHVPLLRMARTAGYVTGMFGKIHHGGDPADYGAETHCLARYWDGYDGPFQKEAARRAKAGMYAISWYWHPGLVADGVGVPTTPDDFGPDIECEHILRFAEANRDRPFIAYWPSNLPHMAHRAEDETWYYPDVPGVDAEGRPTGGRIQGSLESNVRHLDRLVGRIREGLESMGLWDTTVLMFTSDNGTANGDKGSFDRDLGIRVPFVVSGGPVRPRGESRVLVDFTDIWPTIAELAGYRGPTDADGHSFAPYLLDQPFTPRETVRMAMSNARWIRDADWLLDGRGRFWDVRGADSREAYRDVTVSDDPVVAAARRRFETYLEDFPTPDKADPPAAEAWRRYLKRGGKPVPVFRPDGVSE